MRGWRRRPTRFWDCFQARIWGRCWFGFDHNDGRRPPPSRGRRFAQCPRTLSCRTLPTGNRASGRSEEHTSELQSLMRISYAVFCLKKKKHIHTIKRHTEIQRRPNQQQQDITHNTTHIDKTSTPNYQLVLERT